MRVFIFVSSFFPRGTPEYSAITQQAKTPLDGKRYLMSIRETSTDGLVL